MRGIRGSLPKHIKEILKDERRYRIEKRKNHREYVKYCYENGTKEVIDDIFDIDINDPLIKSMTKLRRKFTKKYYANEDISIPLVQDVHNKYELLRNGITNYHKLNKKVKVISKGDYCEYCGMCKIVGTISKIETVFSSGKYMIKDCDRCSFRYEDLIEVK